jgi:hypothetical protein
MVVIPFVILSLVVLANAANVQQHAIRMSKVSTAPSTPNITLSSTTYDCSSSRNTGQTGRLSTMLTCTQLYNWALYLVYNQSACDTSSVSSSYAGTCNSNGSLVNSLYIEFTYGKYRVVASNGIPNHTYSTGAVKTTPNNPCEFYTVMLLPLNASNTGTYSSTALGQTGTANTGAAIYNAQSGNTWCNAAAIEESDTFDTCDGHASPTGIYHYHMQPASTCAYSTGCTLMGYFYDGVPVYSTCSGYTSCYSLVNATGNWSYTEYNSGSAVTVFNGCATTDYAYSSTNYAAGTCNLDKANGITVNGTYRYYMTSTYPFTMYTYAGTKASVCLVKPN